MESKASTRIAWIDIYKAICIILVVVGHSTGMFNMYIYQFHMAAFFFISGYTSKIWKRDLESIFINKFKTVLLPIFTMIVGLALFDAARSIILSEFGFWDGVKYVVKAVVDYLVYDARNNMLGAVWFLPVLFFVFIIQRLIWCVSEKRGIVAYALITVAIYLLGYYLQDNGFIKTQGFDMALIAQIFFGIGVVLNKYDVLEKLKNQKWRFGVYLLAAIYMYIMAKIGGTVVNYPSRMYPNIFLTAVVPLGGIILVFGISEILERLGKVVVWIFSKIGNATLGVLLFHFIGFKVATAMLIPLKVTNAADLQDFLLPQSVSVHWWGWVFYAVISLTFSVLLWTGLMYIPVLNVMLGGGKKKLLKKADKKPQTTE